MKLTKTVYKSEKVEMEVEFPFFCKDENSHTIVCADEKGELYGIKVWVLNELFSITAIIGVSDIKLEGQCTEQEFWDAYTLALTLLSNKGILCRQAGTQTVKEWDMVAIMEDDVNFSTPITEEQSDFLSRADDEFDRHRDDEETPLGEHQDTLGELPDEGMDLI